MRRTHICWTILGLYNKIYFLYSSYCLIACENISPFLFALRYSCTLVKSFVWGNLWAFLLLFLLYICFYADVKSALPGEEARAEVVEDPCKCEARLAFQKQTQAAIQQLTAKHILPVFSDGRQYFKQSATCVT